MEKTAVQLKKKGGYIPPFLMLYLRALILRDTKVPAN